MYASRCASTSAARPLCFHCSYAACRVGPNILRPAHLRSVHRSGLDLHQSPPRTISMLQSCRWNHFMKVSNSPVAQAFPPSTNSTLSGERAAWLRAVHPRGFAAQSRCFPRCLGPGRPGSGTRCGEPRVWRRQVRSLPSVVALVVLQDFVRPHSKVSGGQVGKRRRWRCAELLWWRYRRAEPRP